MSKEIELKGIIEDLLQGFIKVFQGNLFKQQADRFITKKYNDGLDKAESTFKVNFVKTEASLDFLKDYVDGVVGSLTDDISNGLRAELQRSVLDGLTVPQIKKRVKDTFKDKKYMNRLKTVLRTEGNRASNLAQMDAAKQTGLNVYKYLDTIDDDRRSEICDAEEAKYGDKSKAIPLDQEFVVRVNGKTYRAMQPPFHINCRSSVRFVEID